MNLDLFSPDRLWAILPRTLESICDRVVAKQSIETDDHDVKAFITRRGLQMHPDTMLAGMRDAVGVIPVRGVLFEQQYMRIARDFGVLVESGEVESILFDIDSPGGIITGAEELSDLIFEARGQKPIQAHIAGLGASAAFWIASSVDRIQIADTGEAGSIGVVATFIDWRKFDERMGIQEIEIVSSQSPLKRVDPTTDSGRSVIQARVDELADVFIDRVARNRGVARDTVINDFGQGNLIVGQRAVQAGLADTVGSFESLLATLSRQTATRGFNMSGQQKGPALQSGIYHVASEGAEPQLVTIDANFIEQNYPSVAAALRKTGAAQSADEAFQAGAKAERERIQAIEGYVKPGNGLTKFLNEAKFDPAMTPEKAAMEAMRRQAAGELDQQEILASEGEQPIAGDDTPTAGQQAGVVKLDVNNIYAKRRRGSRD